MVLTKEQAKLFYDLWIPLLDFVNRKYKLRKDLYGMDSPKGLPLDVVRIISEKLWEDTAVIDEYIAKKQQENVEEVVIEKLPKEEKKVPMNSYFANKEKNKINNRIKKMEEMISKKEEEMSFLEKEMQSEEICADYIKLTEIQEKITKVMQEIESLMQEWEELENKLDLM